MRPSPAASLAALFLLAAAVPARADLPQIQSSGALRVLVVEGSPAFFSIAGGADPGLDRELLEGFCRLRGLKLSVVPVASWDGLVPALLEGRGDVLAGGVTATAARRAQIAFSTEVFPTRTVVVTRRPHAAVGTLEQLRAERVGTVRGTSLADETARAGVPARNVDDGIPSGGIPAALRSGRVSAAVQGVEDALLAQRADPDLQLGMFLGEPSSLAFGVRKEDTGLRAALDEYLVNVRHTASWSRLVVRYFGESALEILKRARGE